MTHHDALFQDVSSPCVQHAKGALMLRFGIDSHQAFAILVRWSRLTGTSLDVLADALVHGICEGNPETELRHRTLLRWLEEQLRDNDPDVPGRGPTPVAVGAGR